MSSKSTAEDGRWPRETVWHACAGRFIDRAARGEATLTRLCREAGVSRSRFYELRARYRAYGEAGLVDVIVAYAVEHPTRFGGWRVSHSAAAQRAAPAAEGGSLLEQDDRSRC